MALPELEPDTRHRIARECLRHQGMTLMETLVMPRLRHQGAMGGDFLRVEGEQVLVDAHGKGKGVILVTAHLGNWELLPIALQQLRIKGVAMASTLNNERLNRIIGDIRRFEYMDVAERGSGDSPRQLLTCLKRGEVLIMVNDVDIASNGVFCNMFGMPAHTPRGAASIALKLGSPLVTYFDERLADGTHVIRFREIPVTSKILKANSPVQAFTQAICEVTEEHIRAYPEQWIWNHRRWKRRPESQG
jgi:KDO2-lipid IV(A) lauroyltransferase